MPRDVFQFGGNRSAGLGVDQFGDGELALADDRDIDGGEFLERPFRKGGRMWPPDDSPGAGADALRDCACTRGSMNLMRHGGDAKNLGLELMQVLTQYLVGHDLVFGVEDTNVVSFLEKAGGEIG